MMNATITLLWSTLDEFLADPRCTNELKEGLIRTIGRALVKAVKTTPQLLLAAELTAVMEPILERPPAPQDAPQEPQKDNRGQAPKPETKSPKARKKPPAKASRAKPLRREAPTSPQEAP